MTVVSPVSIVQRAATFELSSDAKTIYYSFSPYKIYLNGSLVKEEETNVFSLYGLLPATNYLLQVAFEDGTRSECEFTTTDETMLLDAVRFGAVGDGVTDCTNFLQAAINACPAGGTVYVPEGCYVSYPLFLRSDMLLYLEKGAVLLGGIERSRYPVLPGMVQCEDEMDEVSYGTWEGNPLDSFASIITIIDEKNVSVAGEGVIDGNAQNTDWWQYPKTRVEAWRPRTIFAVRTQNLTLLGVAVQNSPSWTVHPYYCTDVIVSDIKIINPPDSPNTDGCNPESCENVKIIGANISVGDDCIAVKSGKYYMATHHFRRAKNIVVRNCLLQRGHGAIVVGSEIAGGVDGLTVEQCLMRNTDRGLRIKTRRGRGKRCEIQNVLFSYVTMQNVLTPFVVNMFYFCDPDGHSEMVYSKEKLPVSDLTPKVKNIMCRNITCTGAQYAGAFLYALPESPLEEVVFEDVSISFAEDAQAGMPAMMDFFEPVKRLGIFGGNIERLYLQNVFLTGTEGEMYQLDNVGIFENRRSE